MLNYVETFGIRVNNTLPSPYAMNVNLNSNIEIEFNTDIDTKTVLTSIYILKDTKRKYVGKDLDITDENYVHIDCKITCREKTFIFKPKSQLEKNTRYIIYVNNEKVKGIVTGQKMLFPFISFFDTEGSQTFRPSGIILPEDNKVLDSVDKIQIEDVGSEMYLVQMSKTRNFDNIIFEEIYDSNVIEKEMNLGDGLYYIRAKALNGVFGKVNAFTIKTFHETLVSDQDSDEFFVYEEIEDELENIENYPTGNDVSTQTSTCYMKFNKLLDRGDIDFSESNLTGTLSDSDDEGNIDEHGIVDCANFIVRDRDKEETYVLFVPV